MDVQPTAGAIDLAAEQAERLAKALRIAAVSGGAVDSEIALMAIDLHNRVDHLWRRR